MFCMGEMFIYFLVLPLRTYIISSVYNIRRVGQTPQINTKVHLVDLFLYVSLNFCRGEIPLPNYFASHHVVTGVPPTGSGSVTLYAQCLAVRRLRDWPV